MLEQFRAHDVGIARIEGEHCVTVVAVSDWSFPLDPDPLHGLHLYPGHHSLAERSETPVTRITDAT